MRLVLGDVLPGDLPAQRCSKYSTLSPLLHPVHAVVSVLQAMHGFRELTSYWQQWRVRLAATYRRAEEAVAAGEGGGLASAGSEAVQQLQLQLLEMNEASACTPAACPSACLLACAMAA
jgi:hypothetical protein